jgi:hypothetical protein
MPEGERMENLDLGRRPIGVVALRSNAQLATVEPAARKGRS